MKKNFIIYGSYGYTGNLIARHGIEQGLKPILAGRNEEKLKHQANLLDLDYRVFDVLDLEQTKRALQDVIAVIHCAGPFKHTFENMAKACLAVKTHYVDITGEVRVIEKLMQLNDQAKKAGIMLLPGAGFDVVPSDCLALYLLRHLPDAKKLVLAISGFQKDSNVSISHGTAKTMIEDMPEGSLIRSNGKLKKVPFCWKTQTFDFGSSKYRVCGIISWGDLASAWWSTKIPNIETYMALPKGLIRFRRLINLFKNVLYWAPLKNYILHKIDKLPPGPNDQQRQNAIVKIYGEVTNDSGKKTIALMTTPNGYTLTALTTIIIIKHILAGHAPSGFQTPAQAYTEDLIMNIPEVTRVIIIDSIP